MLGSPAMQEAVALEMSSGSDAGRAIEKLVTQGSSKVFFAVGSAGVADNAQVECDASGKKCGLALGYTHNNNGRCYQLRLNTSADVGGQGWQWPNPSGEHHIDIIMQSINTGLNNAFDLYMAQGGAGAWASNDAFGRHSTCSHLWGNLPGFNHSDCLAACKKKQKPTEECPRLCDAARCPHAGGTFEACVRSCPLGNSPLTKFCRSKCRTHCPLSKAAPLSTWDRHSVNNFWGQNLQDTPLCSNIPDDDDELRRKVANWFSFVNPVFPDAQDARESIIESAFTVIKNRFGCLNPFGSWQEVECPYQLTEVTGLRRNDTGATKPCSPASPKGNPVPRTCNPNLRPIDSTPEGKLGWGTHEFGGSGAAWTHEYVLRTDAQITQMMDCRSPDASQCFNLPTGATWEAGRSAARNVDADGNTITTKGIHGCANLPGNDWSDMMNGPIPYVKAVCPVAFSPLTTEKPRGCTRFTNSDICSDMKSGSGCWPGAGTAAVSTFNASDPKCWRPAADKKYCHNPRPPKKSDVFEGCGGRMGKTCCTGLTCFKQSPDYGQCCLSADNPKGCASWAYTNPSSEEKPVGKQMCGLQYVTEGPRYAQNKLGQTSFDSADECAVKVADGYDGPACNAPPLPTAPKVCDGQQEMCRIKYADYGRSQWECKPKCPNTTGLPL